MMKALIDLSAIEKVKVAMRIGSLRMVPPGHRVEAIARGLGWNSNAALRNDLSGARMERDVSDEAFRDYLAEKGFTDVEFDALSKAVSQSTFAVSFSGEMTKVHAPYAVSPLAIHNGPSGRMSPELLREINSGLSSGFYGGPDDKFAEISRHFLERVLPNRDYEGEDFLHRVLSDHLRTKMN